MAAPTEEELLILAKFRDTVADFEMSAEQKTDMALLAWLRARDLDIPKANEMLKKSVAWRKENDIDSVLSWKPPELFKKGFAYEICGQCPDGTPVIVLAFGKWDVRKAVETGQKEMWFRHIDQMFAQTFAVMKKTNEKNPSGQVPITQSVMIVDFDEYPMRQLTSVSSVQTMLETVTRFESNYPESVREMFFINSPRIFSIFFSIIKPVLSARTLSKLEIYSANKSKWIPALLASVPADQLPCALGGTDTASCPFLSKGYINTTSSANDIHDDFGLLTKQIAAGEQFKLDFDARKKNSVIIWTLKLEGHDIGFSIQFNETEVFPYKKYDAELWEQDGSYTCEKQGKYTLVFDNSYSKFRAKTLRYIANINDPSV